ncbi:hypothetical protein OIU76_007729 [Salix suchowensis]|nr:hypothetical protein OIU76_007729 [Salix suchowensis]
MDDRQKVTIPNSLGKRHLNTAKKSNEKHGRKSLSSQGSDDIEEAGEWKEATQFFELPEKLLTWQIMIIVLCKTQISQMNLENGKKVQTITAKKVQAIIVGYK